MNLKTCLNETQNIKCNSTDQVNLVEAVEIQAVNINLEMS